MRRSFILAGAVLTTLVASCAGAGAQQPMQRVQVGILECRGGASVGFIVGSVTNLGCVLRVEGMPEDRYIATIRSASISASPRNRRWPGASTLRSPGSGPAISPAITLAHRGARRLASGSAATRWSAVPTIRSRCSRSACRARSASTSQPGWKAWSFGRAAKRVCPLPHCQPTDRATAGRMRRQGREAMRNLVVKAVRMASPLTPRRHDGNG